MTETTGLECEPREMSSRLVDFRLGCERSRVQIPDETDFVFHNTQLDLTFILVTQRRGISLRIGDKQSCDSNNRNYDIIHDYVKGLFPTHIIHSRSLQYKFNNGSAIKK